MFKKTDDPSPAADTRPAALYAIEDFVGLTAAEVSELLERGRVEIADGVPVCAHLVITHDLSTGVRNHHVPCPSGADAVDLARRVVAERQSEDPDAQFTVSVTPLLPH